MLFSHYLAGGILYLLGLSTIATAGNRLELKNNWMLQPATTVNNSPNSKDWAKWGLRNWRRSRPPKNVSWSKVNPQKINSVWVKNSFKVPEEWSKDKLLLDFYRLEGDSIVFINGKRIGERLRPYGTIDISKAVKPGKNELLMYITRDYKGISRGAKEDPLRYISRKEMKTERFGLGVTAPVFLVNIPRPAGITDVFIKTSWRKKKIAVETEIDSAKKLSGLTLEVKIYDQAGQKVLQFEKYQQNLIKGISKEEISSKWENPIPWMLEKGYIYQAVISLKKDGKVLDTYKQKFGFREVWTEGRTIILNGKPARWRVEWTSFGITDKSMPLLKMLGRNFVYFQPNPTLWWRDWAEVPYYTPKEIELLDREGIGSSLPMPGCSFIRGALLNNRKLIADYKRELHYFIRRYRNHPSILAYTVGMNSFNPKDAIHPDTLGVRSNYNHNQAKVINKAMEIVKENDPTRLKYSHADGNLGDIATANCYPNFAPVQEYEDWPSMWAEKGDMPWFACEMAAFYNGSLYKGKQFLLTEYAATYFGEKAFEKETEKQLEKTMEMGLKHRSHGNNIKDILPFAPIFWDLNRIHVVNTDRAWRTWGVNGWHYFNFAIGYGDPPEKTRKKPFNRYLCLKKKVTKVPEWVTPHFYTYKKNMQPLLVYIAGYPVHTDKDHSFYSGEKVKKQIAAIWDGPAPRILKATWKLVDDSGKIFAQESKTLSLDTGDIKFYPVEFTAPAVSKRTQLCIELKVYDSNKLVDSYKFSLQIFPNEKQKLDLKKRIIIYDPARKLKWLSSITNVVAYKKGMRLGKGDILVLGREALEKVDKLPYTYGQLNEGLSVIVMEQKPEIWEGFGFKSIETAPRQMFIADKQSPIIDGLNNDDLAYWRGSPNLLPEFKHARGYDVLIAPKVTNRNTVASCVLKIPEATGFTPIIKGDFALEYSPLMTFNTGKGVIIFNSLDLTDRVFHSPVPTVIAKRILEFADNYKPENHKAYTGNNQPARKLLSRLKCALSNDLTDSVIVNYKKCILNKTELEKFLSAGGTCISIELKTKELESFGIKTIKRKVYKVPAPAANELFDSVTTDMLRWRDALTINAIEKQNGVYSNGLFMLRKHGKGRHLFIQASPAMLRDRYINSLDKREAMLLSVSSLNRLIAAILTNAGCIPSKYLVKRLASLKTGNSYKELGFWHVLGPFKAKNKTNVKEALDTVFPGEKNAIAGDTNPNLYYKGANGKKLDFRTTATADSKGFINLAKALNTMTSDSIAYAVKEVECNRSGYVKLRLGVDYFMKVWVNGKLEYAVTTGHGAPRQNRHIIQVPMKKGLNVITLKVYSGSKGFGFWANMSEPQTGSSKTIKKSQPGKIKLYDSAVKLRSPFEYHYW